MALYYYRLPILLLSLVSYEVDVPTLPSQHKLITLQALQIKRLFLILQRVLSFFLSYPELWTMLFHQSNPLLPKLLHTRKEYHLSQTFASSHVFLFLFLTVFWYL